MESSSKTARYAVRHENAWGFSVYDTATEKVVEIDGMRQSMMLKPKAERLAEQLNRDPTYRPPT